MDNQPYIQSQYGNSPTIKKLLKDFDSVENPQPDFQVFYDNLFNLETATGASLDVWGNILGVSRKMSVRMIIPKTKLFGFRGSNLNPFNQGVFFTDDNESGAETSYLMNDTEYLTILWFKAAANISSADLYSLNYLLSMVFKNKVLAVNTITESNLPNGDKYNTTPMQVTFVIQQDALNRRQQAHLERCIEECLAAGVGYSITIIPADKVFGYDGSELHPFDQGTFYE